ncbi:hypothetical protein IWZ01DRAFT_506964 [Phyllosticta capitalensis]
MPSEDRILDQDAKARARAKSEAKRDGASSKAKRDGASSKVKRIQNPPTRGRGHGRGGKNSTSRTIDKNSPSRGAAAPDDELMVEVPADQVDLVEYRDDASEDGVYSDAVKKDGEHPDFWVPEGKNALWPEITEKIKRQNHHLELYLESSILLLEQVWKEGKGRGDTSQYELFMRQGLTTKGKHSAKSSMWTEYSSTTDTDCGRRIERQMIVTRDHSAGSGSFKLPKRV